jgi:hypothetical protein
MPGFSCNNLQATRGRFTSKRVDKLAERQSSKNKIRPGRQTQTERTEADQMAQKTASSGLRPAAGGPCVRRSKMAQAGACCGTEETNREAKRAGSKTWARATVLVVGMETTENEAGSHQVRRREILAGAETRQHQ